MVVLTEHQVKKIYDENIKKIVRYFGHRKSTTTHHLDDLGHKLFGNIYIGTFPQDDMPVKIPKKCYFIINTGTKKSKGEHWVAVYKNNHIYYIYDSFGRIHSNIVKHFVEDMSKNSKVRFVDSDRDPEQYGSKSEDCGHRCISFLMIVEDYGIRNALKI